jgi:ribosomal protein S18 acetylase RimI-like enzyme
MQTTLTALSSIPFAIQSASWRDLNAVRHLEKECFPLDAWPLWDLIGVLTMGNIIRLKAVVKDQMVGFIAADIHQGESIAWIATVGVLPEHRRRGIGSTLLMECEERLKMPRLRLSVRRSNSAAVRLYERLNYHQIDTWTGYYQDGEDALVLEKILTPQHPSGDRL